jgi:chemosensory pili system protein ChpC
MNAATETVRSLWVPLAELQLLVPNVAVAEVIDYRTPALIQAGPEWLLGVLRWREQDLPVVSMEQLLGLDPGPPTAGARIAVFNSAKPATSLPFFAAITAGIPRLFSVDEGTLGGSTRGERELADTVADCVRFDGQEVLIPDLEVVQTRVEEAWEIYEP